jgi:AraC-like DNA-binding protein
MRLGDQPLLVLHSDASFRERVRAVSGTGFTFHQYDDWLLLAEAVRTSPPSALVVVDPYLEAEGDGPSRHLKALLNEFPSAPVFAAMVVVPERLDDLRTLGRWGVTQVISLQHDDTVPAMQRRFRSATGRPLKALMEQVLPIDTSGRARALLDAAAEVVAVAGSAEDLAKRLRISRRTLLRWCQRSELPPPRELLAWMRILLAAELLDDPGRTVVTVAQGCGYSSDSGLRRVMAGFLGMSPRELRQRGAFTEASKAFLLALEQVRETRQTP